MSLSSKRVSRGFTLIELIITIVIIGVLAAVAIPKFQNLSGDAEKGVAAGVASAIASASSVNYARSVVPGATVCVAGSAIGTNPAGCTFYAITSCADLSTNIVQLADVPTGYTVGGGAAPLTPGASAAGCSAVAPAPSTATAPFNAYGS